MKKSTLLFVILALAASCAREQEAPELSGKEIVVFTAGIDTKTSLGDKVGNVYPNLWSQGDEISVNGVTSSPLSSEYDKASSAQFDVAGVTAPYFAAYPASAVSGYSNGTAALTIPTEQTWHDNSYDPSAFVITATSNETDLAFGAKVAMLKVTPNADPGVKIKSVKILADDAEKALSGVFTSDFASLGQPSGQPTPFVVSSSVDGVPSGEPWILCFAPTDFTSSGFSLIVTDSDGGRMVKSISPGKAYEAGKIYSGSVDFVPEDYYNVFGRVTCGGEPVADVLVSDGVEIVKTDASGQYKMNSAKKWKYVFVIIPRGYMVPTSGVLPHNWAAISADTEELDRCDFELVENPGDDYTLFVLGDIHLARRTGDLAQFDKVATFMRKYMDAAPGKVYALTLGDMTWDMYWIANNYSFGDYLQTVNGYFSGIPFFHTMGNHDNEMEVGGDYLKALKYTENLSPDYYSFNLGKIHYIVMDNMDFTDVEPGQDNRSKYAKNFTAEQLEWLRKDLSYVDKSTPIFVTAHEPLARPSGISWGEFLNGKDADLDEFIDIFSGYNVRFLSGHTHNIFNHSWAPGFVEHNSGAVCASWWWSGYITPGIHVAQDGTPGGFTIWTVNGTDCTHYYQAALQSPEYQFRAYDMNRVKSTITSDLSDHSGYPKYYNHVQSFGDNVILVNVWDYDDDWTVEISENGTPLDVEEVGVYDPLHIYAMTIPRLNDYNTTTFSTAKWRHFFQATASSSNTPVTITVTDRYGRVYTEEMTRPKAFNIDEYKNEVEYKKPQAEFVASSSSSLVFGWNLGGTAAEDAALPYKVELFRDSACSDLVLSFDIGSANSCWDGNPLRFTFGSLDPDTEYWFKVTNALKNDSSEPVSGRTKAFTVVDATKVENAGAGDVILAEDFSEIVWGADMLATAAGFIPSGKPFGPMSGNYTSSDGNFQTFDNTAGRIYGEARVTSDMRLFNWGFFGNSAVYSYAGYLRVGTSSSGARTHIVSPALSGIPAGKLATIDVTVTSSIYSSGGPDVAVFVNDHSSLTLALAPDQKESTNPKFSSSGGKYTGASLTDGYPLQASVKKWTTNTVRIEGVTASDCLIFGSIEDIDTKNRFFLNDVKVQIVSLSTPPEISASLGKASSSTLSFTWTEGMGASTDISKPWTIALYKDAACTDLEASFDIPKSNGCWNSKQPRFVFSGLKPSTKYYFKAIDTTEGAVKESNVVEATTAAFTHVYPEDVPVASVGDIILAEDFGELCWCSDLPDAAAGYDVGGNSKTSLYSREYSSFQKGNTSPTERIIGSQTEALKESGLRLAKWAQGNNNVYIHPGYFKLSTNSTNNSHLITPALTSIPDGMAATVEVTTTAAGWGANYTAIAAVQHSNAGSINDLPGKNTSLEYSNISTITLSGGEQKWSTQTLTLTSVVKGDRIAIGSTETVSTGKGRMMLSDVTIKVIALDDANRTIKVSIIGDSISTFKGWCDTTKGGAYYPKSDGDVSSVSDTWWYKLIYSKMHYGIFEKNISAGNTTVVQNTTGDSSAYWYGWDFGTRLQQLGIGNPDVVLIHGGTNDYGHTSWYSTSEKLIDGVAMNVSSFPSDAREALDALFEDADAATTVAAADALDGTTFCSAYIRLIKMIQTRHPSAKVVCVIGDYLRGGQGDAIKLIAQHFGDDKVRVADILGEKVSISKYSNPHPDAAGMTTMASFIYSKVGSWIDEQ